MAKLIYCPECGTQLIPEGGCLSCPCCGWNACEFEQPSRAEIERQRIITEVEHGNSREEN